MAPLAKQAHRNSHLDHSPYSCFLTPPTLTFPALTLRLSCGVRLVTYTSHVDPFPHFCCIKSLACQSNLGGGSQKLLENLIEALSMLPPILHMPHKVA